MRIMTGIVITGMCAVLTIAGCKKPKHTVDSVTETERSFDRYRVMVDVAIIRQGAGRNTGEIGKVKEGELVLICGSTGKREVIGGRNGVWMKAYVGGKDGFIFGGLIRPEAEMFNPPYRDDDELAGKRYHRYLEGTSYSSTIKFEKDNIVEEMGGDESYRKEYTGKYQVLGNVVFIKYNTKKDITHNIMDGTSDSSESTSLNTRILRLERTDDADSGDVVAVTNEEGEERMTLAENMGGNETDY